MAQNNNFVILQSRPLGQRVYYATPRVKLFEETDTLALEILINDWLDALALPLDPDNLITIIDTQYSSAQENNNTISYSALIHYTHWQPQ
jgi:hypothetical protein